jgi:hypothetical protein
MRFLSIYKSAETGVPPTAEYMATMQRLVEEGMKAGWLVATEGCLPSALGARVRSSGGKLSVTDGPFVESKEVIGGFAILEASSKRKPSAWRRISSKSRVTASVSCGRFSPRRTERVMFRRPRSAGRTVYGALARSTLRSWT